MHSTAPLDSLYISELNVRKTDRSIDIDLLAANIKANGLKQNLDVVEEDLAGQFGVTDGGRRLLALQLLDERGEWPSDKIDREAIPILIEPRELGRETSLSANLQRVPMNPADEVEAFAAIIADYAAQGERDPDVRIARCARHFGRTVRYIEQRLRLADLAPDILEALRAGSITVDAARAYAAVADHALQLQVFVAQEAGRTPGINRHSPHAIRSAFAGKIYKRGDRQVRYVGLDAYTAAGGRVVLDLFMGAGDDEVLLDTDLVDRLCLEKAEREAEARAREDGFARGVVAGWAGASWSWPKTPAGGYERAVNGAPPEIRPTAIAIYRIGEDGAGLELTSEYFRHPAAAAAAAAERLEAPIAAEPVGLRPPKNESQVERLARIRREKTFIRAARLAAPPTTGTPLEGRAFWPADGQPSIPPVHDNGDGTIVVAMLVVIPRDDVEQLMGAAEILLDQEEAETDRARAGEAEPVAPEPVQ